MTALLLAYFNDNYSELLLRFSVFCHGSRQITSPLTSDKGLKSMCVDEKVQTCDKTRAKFPLRFNKAGSTDLEKRNGSLWT